MLYPVQTIIDPDLDPDLRGYMTVTARDGDGNTSSVTALVRMTTGDGQPTLTGDDLVFTWTSRGPSDGKDEPPIGTIRFDRYGRRWERLAEPEGWGTDDLEGVVRPWPWLLNYRGPLKSKVDPKRDVFPPEPTSLEGLCTCVLEGDVFSYTPGCPEHPDPSPELDVADEAFVESHQLVDELQELGIDPTLADELLELHAAPYEPIELDDTYVPTESSADRREREQRYANQRANARRELKGKLFGGTE